MAGGINRVILVGRLTKDVEVRKTQTGISVASFTVAVDRRVSRDSRESQGQQTQTADFINCVAWRQRADFLSSYAHKGTLVGVEGSIQTRNYTNQSGQKVYVTEILADSVQILESKGASASRESGSYSNNSYGGSSMGSERMPAAPSYDDGGFGSDDFNTGPSLDISSDDLPF